MKVIIDRIEGAMVVCEKPDGTMLNIPRSKLPPEAREGDVLVIEGESIRVDSAETTDRKKAAKNLMKDLWK